MNCRTCTLKTEVTCDTTRKGLLFIFVLWHILNSKFQLMQITVMSNYDIFID